MHRKYIMFDNVILEQFLESNPSQYAYSCGGSKSYTQRLKTFLNYDSKIPASEWAKAGFCYDSCTKTVSCELCSLKLSLADYSEFCNPLAFHGAQSKGACPNFQHGAGEFETITHESCCNLGQ